MEFTVVFTGNAAEANLVKGALSAAGIESHLQDEIMGEILPLSGMPTGFGSVKVVVAGKDVERARKVTSAR